MATITCKKCGGCITIEFGENLTDCPNCGSYETAPTTCDETMLDMFNQANLLRIASDFEKAESIYRSILSIAPGEAEAHWGLLLCKYGIHYENDPSSGRKVPICKRDLIANEDICDHITDDENFKKAAELSDFATRRIYHQEADTIESSCLEIIKQFRRNQCQIAIQNKKYIQNCLSACYDCTAFLSPNGTVRLFWKECFGSESRQEASAWKDIVDVDISDYGIVGLRADGSVISIEGALTQELLQWTDMIAVCIGKHGHIVGLKADGTVLATMTSSGGNKGQCDVTDWKNIVAIGAGEYHTVGLKSDGTVVAVGCNDKGQCDVSHWTDVIAISVGRQNTIGLKSDGTVVAAGSNYSGQCNVGNWRNICAVSAGTDYTVGLKSDGTVIAVGSNKQGQCDVRNWKDIVAICCGHIHTVGLKSDGSLVAVGNNRFGQCDVSGIHFLHVVNDGDVKIHHYTEEESRLKWRKAGRCQHCGGKFVGLFSYKCAACKRKKDY